MSIKSFDKAYTMITMIINILCVVSCLYFAYANRNDISMIMIFVCLINFFLKDVNSSLQKLAQQDEHK
jgi:hypothetical protein